MKISVIIPVYNVEKYLNKCIRSVLAQTYKNIEILLVDDGSDDNSGNICDEWAAKDSRIIVFHKKNGGQGTARNLALDNIKGDYVLFVDSDDEIDCYMIEKMLKPMDEKCYDLVMCGFKVNNGFRTVDANWYKDSIRMNNTELIKAYIVDGLIFTGPVCKLFARHLFNSIRFPNFRANEDAFILHHIFDICKNAAIISDHLYTINLRAGSTEGRSFNENKMHLIDCAVDLRQFIKSKYPEYSSYVESKVLKDSVYLLSRMYSDNSEYQYSELENQLIQIVNNEVKYLSDIGMNDETNIATGIIKDKDKYKKLVKSKAKIIKLKRNLIRLKMKISHVKE